MYTFSPSTPQEVEVVPGYFTHLFTTLEAVGSGRMEPKNEVD